MSQDRHDGPRGEPSAEDQNTSIGEDELAQQLSNLARTLQAHTDTDAVLDDIVSAAVALIPGTDEGSISVVAARRHLTSQSPTGDLPRKVDALQEEVGEGPCLAAVYEQQTVRVPDMAHEDRWPKFATRAAEIGALSMLSFQLYVEGDNLAALNLYSRRPNAFDDESEHVGLLFACQAAVAFADAQKLDQLNHKVETRDVIGMAKGILIERFRLTPDESFRVLVQASQHTNRKLRDVADQLVTTGQLPAPDGGTGPAERRPAGPQRLSRRAGSSAATGTGRRSRSSPL